jgi:hypothetical protein
VAPPNDGDRKCLKLKEFGPPKTYPELSRPHGQATALASCLTRFYSNNTAMGEHDVQQV